MPRKPSVVGRRNAESSNFHPSSADETQNTAKTARRRPTKRRITRFLLFPTLGKSKTLKNCISQLWESQNRPKTAFPPRPKNSNHPKASSTKKKMLILHWLVDSTARVSSCFSRKKVHITFGGTKKYPYLCTRSSRKGLPTRCVSSVG